MDKLLKTNVFDRCSNRLLAVIFLVLAVMLGHVGESAGQRGRRDYDDRDVESAARAVREIGVTILKDHVAKLTPLGAEDIEAISEELEVTKRYHGRFVNKDKAYLNLVKAYLAHYSGDGEKALEHVEKAFKDDPENTDASDSVILLALLWENYELAQQVLAGRGGGVEALANVTWSQSKWGGSSNVGAGAAVPSSSDPNYYGRNPSDPNTYGMSPGDPNTFGRTSAQKPKSKWQKSSSSERRSYGRRSGGDDSLLLVGPGAGPIAPINPNFMDGGSRRPPPPRSRPSKRRRRGRRDIVLNLVIENMPYVDLGKDFQKVQLRNFNGSYFYFEPGKGQILCMLMWSLEDDNFQGSRRRRRTASGGQDEPEYQIGMGMSELIRGKLRDKELRKGDFNQEINIDQFRKLFGILYPLATGKIEFLSINCNDSSSKVVTKLTEKFAEQPWPWSNCIMGQSGNKEQLDYLTATSPVMMIVGTNGKIRYAGPAGGVLAQMVLVQELGRAVVAESQRPSLSPMGRGSGQPGGRPAGQSSGGFMGLLFGGSKGTDVPAPRPSAIETQPRYQPDEIEEKQPVKLREKKSSYQAQNILSSAYTLKKTRSFIAALNKCDDILERFPDSLEVDKAKLLITDIIRGRSTLKKSREYEGKWIGDVEE